MWMAAGRDRGCDRDPHEHVLDLGLGVFDLDVEVAVVVEDAGVDQLELHRRRAARRAFSSTNHS
jgi:hypothetical protein